MIDISTFVEIWSRRLRGEAPGLAPLLLALAFGAVALVPETRIGALPPNDLTFHLALSERMAGHLSRGEPLLDPWLDEWALGYPVWRSYQPLPHVLGALWLAAAPAGADPAACFAWLHYLLAVSLPLSLYIGARRLGLAPLGAGLFSLLSLTPSAASDLGRYGLGYGAVVWRGSGLFTQVVAIHLLALALGEARRALDGEGSKATAPLLLALTALSHIVFGWVGFVCLALLAALGPAAGAARRLARLAVVVLPALALLAWFFVPLWLGRAEVNHSRWEDAVKWDSYGFPVILGDLVHGRFFDAWRWPVLSVAIAAGALIALALDRGPLARRLAALAAAWLALFAGREAWGHLMLLAGTPRDLHIHRLQVAFELSALLLAAFGLERGLAAARRRHLLAGAAAGVALAAGVAYLLADRRAYLAQNAQWGEETLEAWARDRRDLEAALATVKAILAERPGRVSAGKAAEWGRDFKVGSVPLYAFLTREHLDQASFLYHSMSLTADVMVLRNEENLAHHVALGIRAVLAPAERRFPATFRRRAVHGRFAVWETSPEGYFGLVELGGRYTGPAAHRYEPSKAWLESAHLGHGVVMALDDRAPPELPAFGRWQPLPGLAAGARAPRGRIVSESKDGSRWRARYELVRPSWALVKITWHPDLEARLDGRPVPLLRVTPGFGAVAMPAGGHDVEVRWRPSRLKPALLGLGLVAFAAFAAFRHRIGRRAEAALAGPIDAMLARLATPRARAALAVAALAVVAFRPLWRGKLVSGHDATEYPPRLVEFARALADGHIPPVWAPDLGAGHGQPLFGFAPPLVYAAALPPRALGLGLADSLQLGLFCLHLAGAAAVYRLGRRGGGGRAAALTLAAGWCFAPYIALDLLVRTAWAEAAAVAVSPLALLGLLRAIERPSARRVAAAATALALLPLAHNAVALVTFPALAVVAAAAIVCTEGRRERARSAAVAALAFAGALALSAFFWLPALAEKGFVKTDLLREGFLHWSQHAISPRQLLWSRWGFGLSGPGTGDGMSFALGPVHLLFAALGLRAAWSAGRRERGLACGQALAALLGGWLATDLAARLWARVETLQYLAYPWRTLAVPALFLPLLARPWLERLSPRRAALAAAVLVAFNLPHTEPKGYLTFDDEYYAPESIASREIKTSTREEYEPRWAVEPPRYTPDRLRGVGAPVEVVVRERRAVRESLEVRSALPVRVETAALYYPGMTVRVEGREVRVEPAVPRGTMLFDLPAGRSEVEIAWHPTPLRRRAWRLSLLAALGLAALALRRGRPG